MEQGLNQRTYGLACAASGAVLVAAGVVFDQARFGEPDVDTTHVRIAQTLFVASVPGLAGGVHALASLHAGRGGRATHLGKTIAYTGLAATAMGSLFSVIRPAKPPWLNPVGSVLQSVGMLVLGSATLRSSVFADWSRWVPLLIGAWFFAHMPAQFAWFASPSGIPSHTLMMGVWGPLWALLGAVLIKHARIVAPAHASVYLAHTTQGETV